METVWGFPLTINYRLDTNDLDIARSILSPHFNEYHVEKFTYHDGDTFVDLGCYSDDTEILTENGWKYFEHVNYNDAIATLNENGYLEYQKPTNIIKKPYKGKMYNFSSIKFDLLVTPDHQMYVKDKRKNNYIKRSAHKIGSGIWELKRDAKWDGRKRQYHIIPKYKNVWSSGRGGKTKREKTLPKIKIPMNVWLKFLAYFVSEGCASNYRISIFQKFGSTYYNDVIDIMEKVDVGRVRIRKRKDQIRINNVSVAKHLRETCGTKAWNKHVPNYVKQLPPSQLKIFITYLMRGDGHIRERGGYTERVYVSCSKRLVDDVQEILLKMGISGNIQTRSGGKCFGGKYESKGYYVISFVLHNKPRIRKKHILTTHYDGMVYCVTVPNHIIYVRRNGKPIWCGNSHIGMWAILMASYSPTFKVYAVEPIPENYNLIQMNIQSNNLTNVTPLNVAISDSIIYYPERPRDKFIGAHRWVGSPQGGDKYITVPAISLDELFDKYNIQHCRVLKTDMEGSEIKTFRDVSDRNLQKIDYVIGEFHAWGEDVETFFSYFHNFVDVSSSVDYPKKGKCDLQNFLYKNKRVTR